MTKNQQLKHRRNIVSQRISALKRAGTDASREILEMKDVSHQIEDADSRIKLLEQNIGELMLMLPNIPDSSVPVGKDENDNHEMTRWGEPTEFDFQPKNHVDLGVRLGVIDMERAGKVAGARFYYLKGDLVRLNYALMQFALDFMEKKGFTLTIPPYMLKREAISGAVILSDFENVLYKIEDEDLYLIGTSEHALLAMHMDEILDGRQLPFRYTGISPNFRKEAGTHGKDTKGIFRVHQFEKVEQFVFCKAEQSWKEHEQLIRNAEEFFQLLQIPYRVMLLCTGDMGKVSAKTYDLELWIPSQGRYREAVSCSNCTDYQGRRLKIRYRDQPHEETKLVHTLNSTLVATERTIVAIAENYQQRDRSIIVPRVLRDLVGKDRIVGKKK